MNNKNMQDFEKIRTWVKIPDAELYTFIAKRKEPGLYRVFLKGEKEGEILFYDKLSLALARRAVQILREDPQHTRYWAKILNGLPLEKEDILL